MIVDPVGRVVERTRPVLGAGSAETRVGVGPRAGALVREFRPYNRGLTSDYAGGIRCPVVGGRPGRRGRCALDYADVVGPVPTAARIPVSSPTVAVVDVVVSQNPGATGAVRLRNPPIVADVAGQETRGVVEALGMGRRSGISLMFMPDGSIVYAARVPRRVFLSHHLPYPARFGDDVVRGDVGTAVLHP